MTIFVKKNTSPFAYIRRADPHSIEIKARRVYANNRQFATVPELKHEIFTNWVEIEMEDAHNLVSSMLKRFFNMIQNIGSAFNY